MPQTAFRLLLIEDNPGDARLVREGLAECDSMSYELMVSESLGAGLQRLSDNSIDLVLLDLYLPDSSGIDSLIQARAASAEVPIVVLTGIDDGQTALEALRKGAQDYLVKGRIEGPLLERTMRHAVERKRLEQALRESEKKYREVVQGANSIILRWDTSGRITFFNTFAEHFFGYSQDEILGKEVFGTIVPETDTSGNDLKAMVLDIIAHPEDNAANENENILKNGERVWVSWTNQAVRDENGRIVELLSIGTDATQRRRAEIALRESEERYRTFVKNVPIAVYRVTPGPEGRFLVANQALLKMFGFEHLHELAQYTLADLYQDRAERKRVSDKVIAEDGISEYEIAMKKKSGTPVWAMVSARPIHNEQGTVVYFDCMALDVTARKKAEEEKHELEAQLRQAQKMEAIGTLAGGIAHDFNNILTAVIGYANLAELDTPTHSRAKPNLQHVVDAAMRAKDLVDQILAFSRQTEQQKRPVNLISLMKEALKLLRATLPATIEIHARIEEEIGLVMADPTQIHQVLMNLCTNAAHAMRERGGTLTVGLTPVEIVRRTAAYSGTLQPGRYVQLWVQDTGLGMTTEVLTRVFEPYFTTKEAGEGTGLGLAVVHGIVTGCNGSIDVESKPGTGSLFRVYLPMVEDHDEEKPIKPDPPPKGHERIMFVDDEEFMVDLGKQILERLGYSVTTRTSSVEALELFRSCPDRFDLVITDMTMPNVTGDKLAREILEIRPDIPVILCTGFSEKISERSAKELGIRMLIMKPLIPNDLAEKIRFVLDGDARPALHSNMPERSVYSC